MTKDSETIALSAFQISAITDKALQAWFAEDPQTSTRTLKSFVEEAVSEALLKQGRLYEDGAETRTHEDTRRLDFILNWNSPGHPLKTRGDIDAVLNAK